MIKVATWALCTAAALSFGAHTSFARQPSEQTSPTQPEWTFSQDDPEHGNRTCIATVSSPTYSVSVYGTVADSLWLAVEKYAEDRAEKTFQVDDGFTHSLTAVDDGGEVKGLYTKFPPELIYDFMNGKELVLSAYELAPVKASLKGSQAALRSFLACFMGFEKWEDLNDPRSAATNNVSARITGTCQNLIVADRNRTDDCAANRGAALERNRESGFSVVVVYDNPKTMLSFSGTSTLISPDGEIQYQPVTVIRRTGTSGMRDMAITIGACAIPMNSYDTGMASIRCYAVDGEGQEYKFQFEKNVMPAEIAAE